MSVHICLRNTGLQGLSREYGNMGLRRDHIPLFPLRTSKQVQNMLFAKDSEAVIWLTGASLKSDDECLGCGLCPRVLNTHIWWQDLKAFKQ